MDDEDGDNWWWLMAGRRRRRRNGVEANNIIMKCANEGEKVDGDEGKWKNVDKQVKHKGQN